MLAFFNIRGGQFNVNRAELTLAGSDSTAPAEFHHMWKILILKDWFLLFAYQAKCENYTVVAKKKKAMVIIPLRQANT